MPDLDFSIESAEAQPFAATPTLLFKLRMRNRTPEAVRSVMLKVQVQILAAQRPYNGQQQERLSELFGRPEQWSDSLKTLSWTQSTVLVPAFDREIVVDVPVACTYDFEVVSTRYFYALEEGHIPLEFLFSGTMFYEGPVGLQAAQIPWEKEAAYQLPACAWHELLEHYFPDSAWLRLRKDAFDALYSYKRKHRLPNWEAALQQLLEGAEQEVEVE